MRPAETPRCVQRRRPQRQRRFTVRSQGVRSRVTGFTICHACVHPALGQGRMYVHAAQPARQHSGAHRLARGGQRLRAGEHVDAEAEGGEGRLARHRNHMLARRELRQEDERVAGVVLAHRLAAALHGLALVAPTVELEDPPAAWRARVLGGVAAAWLRGCWGIRGSTWSDGMRRCSERVD